MDNFKIFYYIDLYYFYIYITKIISYYYFIQLHISNKVVNDVFCTANIVILYNNYKNSI